jgi:integrase
MPQLKYILPKYRLHKQSGQAVVTLNGKDILLGTHGTAASKAEYDRVTGEWMANGRRLPEPSGESDLTIAEFVQAFWQHAKGYYGRGHREGAGEAANFKPILRRLRRMYGRTFAKDFGPLALKALRAEAIKPQKTDPVIGLTTVTPGWSRTYTNRQIKRLGQVFSWGVENELVEPAVLAKLREVKSLEAGRSEARETEKVKPVPDTHVDAVLPLLSRQVQAMIQLQRLTAMRPGEVCAMRGADVDTSSRTWV